MSTFKERLYEFISETGLTPTKFERDCGLSVSAITNMGRGLNSMNVGRICAKFPELNMRWLVLGEGEMYDYTLNSDGITNKETTTLIQDKLEAANQRIEDLLKYIDLQNQLIAMLKAQLPKEK